MYSMYVSSIGYTLEWDLRTGLKIASESWNSANWWLFSDLIVYVAVGGGGELMQHVHLHTLLELAGYHFV